MNLNQKLGPAYDTDLVQGSPIEATGPGGQTARTETMDNARLLIDAALAALPAQQREIMLLFHQQSWPIAEIAEHLDMPQGTVKSHLHRGRGRMRRFIEANRAMHRHVQEVFS
jgi:RNA polymerase sigma-70 factor (ECF subfamily)